MKRSSRAGRLTQLERNQRTTGIFFILPSLVLCAIFMVVPLINVIRYSLTDLSLIHISEPTRRS